MENFLKKNEDHSWFLIPPKIKANRDVVLSMSRWDSSSEAKIYQSFFVVMKTLYEKECQSAFDFYYYLCELERLCFHFLIHHLFQWSLPSSLFSFLIQDGLFPFLNSSVCWNFVEEWIIQSPCSRWQQLKKKKVDSFYSIYQYDPFERLLASQPFSKPTFLLYRDFLIDYHHLYPLHHRSLDQLTEAFFYTKKRKLELCQGFKEFPWAKSKMKLLWIHFERNHPFLEVIQPWLCNYPHSMSKEEWIEQPSYSFRFSPHLEEIRWKTVDLMSQQKIKNYFQRFLQESLSKRIQESRLDLEEWSQVISKQFPWDDPGLTFKQINQYWFHMIGRLRYFFKIHPSFLWKCEHHLFQWDTLWHAPLEFVFPEWWNWDTPSQIQIQNQWNETQSSFFSQWIQDVFFEITQHRFHTPSISEIQLQSIQSNWMNTQKSNRMVSSVLHIIWKDQVYHLLESFSQKKDLELWIQKYLVLENKYGNKLWKHCPPYWKSENSAKETSEEEKEEEDFLCTIDHEQDITCDEEGRIGLDLNQDEKEEDHCLWEEELIEQADKESPSYTLPSIIEDWY